MAQHAELSAILENFEKNAPEPVLSVITKARNDFIESFDPKAAIQVGETLPKWMDTIHPFKVPVEWMEGQNYRVRVLDAGAAPGPRLRLQTA
ncbi:hypothetical protein V1508DRAFT_397514 [Lipomyces doorenjongii]|uniref:uncharacterized protein n=1 Tax=Lipomyces doorenjongii TaxID=383834 RepID=UPI0034CFE084